MGLSGFVHGRVLAQYMNGHGPISATRGYILGIVLSNLRKSSNFYNFHPDNLDTLTKT